MIAIYDSWTCYLTNDNTWVVADLGSGLGGPFKSEGAANPLRHGKNYNQVYAYGHVDAMTPSVLFNPTNTAVLWNRDHQPHPEYWGNLWLYSRQLDVFDPSVCCP